MGVDGANALLNVTSFLSDSSLSKGFNPTTLPPDGPMACTVTFLVSSSPIMSAPYLTESPVACLIFDTRPVSR